MTDDKTVIEQAKIKIGDIDSVVREQSNEIDVRVAFNEGGPVKFYTVRFYKEMDNNKIMWCYPKVIDRS